MMKSTFSLPTGVVAIWLLTCLPKIQAHSWVEQISVIASNGTFVGIPGYPRGLVDRTVAGWNNDDMTFLVPPNTGSNSVSPTQAMCQYPTPSQEANRPILAAAAGDRIALRYQENGHVTMPDLSGLKPNNSGTVFVYGTTKPLPTDKYLDIHGQWNTDGTGGDGRGVLLATQFFDDGQCYQVNGAPISQTRQKEFPHATTQLMGPDLWCQNDLTLPSNVTGTYTLYWVWDWPTLNTDGSVAKNESYTTCMDISISGSESTASKQGVSFKAGQDLNFAAISSELENNFVAPTRGFLGGDSGVTKSGAPAVAAPPVPSPPAPSPPAPSPPAPSPAPPKATVAASANPVTVAGSPAIQYTTVTVTAGQTEATANSSPEVQPFLDNAGEITAPSPKPRRRRHSREHRLPFA